MVRLTEKPLSIELRRCMRNGLRMAQLELTNPKPMPPKSGGWLLAVLSAFCEPVHPFCYASSLPVGGGYSSSVDPFLDQKNNDFSPQIITQLFTPTTALVPLSLIFCFLPPPWFSRWICKSFEQDICVLTMTRPFGLQVSLLLRH